MPTRLRRNPDAAAIQRRHRDAEPVALFADQPVFVHDRVERDVVRDRRVEPELLLRARHIDVVAVDDERGHTAC